MSLPIIEPKLDACTGKSADRILRRGAELLIAHFRPPAEVSQMSTLADIVKRSTHEHYTTYAETCLQDGLREAREDPFP